MTEFTLDNNRVRVAVWNYGATLVSVVVPDLAGARRNVVIRLPDLAAYEAAENRAYVGSTMGRFARIVAGGRLVIDGREYELARNAGPHHIHGGPEGFDARVWDGHADSGEKSGRVVLTLVSPDGDQGYPGELIATTTYELDIHNRLTIEFTATTDAPTLCGLSNHAFWNLGSEPRIDGHELQLHARRVLAGYTDFVPSGRTVPVDDTELDFSYPHVLQRVRIDAFLALDSGHPVAKLHDPESGRLLVVDTDQPGMAVYTGDFLPVRPRAGICLQPCAWPDAPNHAGFPSAVLRPGETYRSRTTFELLADQRR
ncbi:MULTISPECIES: aldose epimerase family protein [Rhodococcus]|uniref:aldose epimerase family protein n=1 Tax=Rhodococcus TaxID=1827 RepID=UPI0012FAE89F|nr:MULTISPECIES: aldose epimerase family protein [Rhodococcus]QQZ18261.1 galactose mutarotase [Rhodococcus sp. 21391]UOT08196.1 galactose mutarotase [Rhodococcus opacus]